MKITTLKLKRILFYSERLPLYLILAFHLAAVFVFFPPNEILKKDSLHFTDHPVHTHRVYMYRQSLAESGLPWGYDPGISGGAVVHPAQDIGAKPQQILGVLLPFLSSGAVVRLFLFIALITFPLWTLLVCRELGIPHASQAWIMFVLIIPTWLYEYLISYFRWGLVSFAVASYFLPIVLYLFLRFINKPEIKSYVIFCLSAAFAFFFHMIGPVVIAFPLGLYVMFYRRIKWKWRFLAFATPLFVCLLNAFWFIPFLYAELGTPEFQWPAILSLETEPHLTYTSVSQVISGLSPSKIVVMMGGAIFASYGFILLKKMTSSTVSVAFALSAVFALFLKYAGSFIPVLVDMQPSRFLVPAFVFLSIPIGIGLSEVVKKIPLPRNVILLTITFLVVLTCIFLKKPEHLPLPPRPDLLGNFILENTALDNRLLIQSHDGYKFDGYESKIFPLEYGREVIGSNFPNPNDPAQFLRNTLWGKEFSELSPLGLRRSLDRWGISWVFTQTQNASDLFSKTLKSEGIKVGKYSAFKVPHVETRFLKGQGRIQVKVNHMELNELVPEDGLVVLRYRYHPAWETDSGATVYQYENPEDPSGFIALRNPSKSETLNFKPWLMLTASW